jgi:hypothetical protein
MTHTKQPPTDCVINHICVGVDFERHLQFRQKVEQIEDCRILSVVEVLQGKSLLYIIDCPQEKTEIIEDLAAMTIIKNPEFQKYYI